MQLHQLKSSHRKYPAPPVGRGGKRGTYSGRGTKGQKARAGHRIRPAERDFIQRLPKLRGIKNRPTSEKATAVNLDSLGGFPKGAIINAKALAEAEIIRKPGERVKILGRGELTQALTFQNLEISKSAAKKIIAAGGRIEATKSR